MKRTRLFRRQQHGRAIRRAKRFLKMIGWEASERQVHLFARTRRPCSCHMCKNEKYREHNRDEEKVLCRECVAEWETEQRDEVSEQEVSTPTVQ